MKGFPHWLVREAHHASTRDFYPALVALVRPVQNILFLIVHIISIYVCNAQQPGQAVVQGRISLNVCLWLCLLSSGSFTYSHIPFFTLCISPPLSSLLFSNVLCLLLHPSFLISISPSCSLYLYIQPSLILICVSPLFNVFPFSVPSPSLFNLFSSSISPLLCCAWFSLCSFFEYLI